MTIGVSNATKELQIAKVVLSDLTFFFSEKDQNMQ
jgi:hypothetical protein